MEERINKIHTTWRNDTDELEKRVFGDKYIYIIEYMYINEIKQNVLKKVYLSEICSALDLFLLLLFFFFKGNVCICFIQNRFSKQYLGSANF